MNTTSPHRSHGTVQSALRHAKQRTEGFGGEVRNMLVEEVGEPHWRRRGLCRDFGEKVARFSGLGRSPGQLLDERCRLGEVCSKYVPDDQCRGVNTNCERTMELQMNYM